MAFNRYPLCKLLLMSAVSVDSADGRSCVGEVKTVKRKLRALRKQVPDSVASFQTPYTHFLFDDTEVNRTYTFTDH